jgi:hypothetical protein
MNHHQQPEFAALSCPSDKVTCIAVVVFGLCSSLVRVTIISPAKFSSF